MQKNTDDLIVKIEEYINRDNRHSTAPLSFIPQGTVMLSAAVCGITDKQKNKIDLYVKDINGAGNDKKKMKTQPEYVFEKMADRGFVHEDGQLYYSKFYTYAQINSDVWHTFVTQKHKPSEDTMFKIIFALQLNEEEAKEFLSLGGYAFNLNDETHKYILACINTKIYDPYEVYEVLKFYKEQKHNIRNIYELPKKRIDGKERK